MASLSTQNFTDIVRNISAAIQAKAAKLINLVIGSTLRAIVEANAATILWLQGLVAYTLTLTRFNTSKGQDADSWAGDFGFERLAARSATGNVTFSRFTTTAQSVVPFGALLQSADGTQTFTINTDPANPAYSLAAGGYLVGIGVATLTVAVTAVTPGTGGNVLANTITSMGQGIPGVDTVTNSAAFVDGADAESDTSFYARFVLWVNSLSQATDAAIRSAVAGVEQGLQVSIIENQDLDGTYDPGLFNIIVDDGSGAPSAGLLASVQSAVEAVRALGIRFGVFAPTVVTANVGMTITSAPGLDHPTVVGNVGVTVTDFLNTLPLAAGLPYNRLPAVAFGVAGVINVSDVLLNGTTADIAGDVRTTIKAGTVSVA